jgi:hypothetical protein
VPYGLLPEYYKQLGKDAEFVYSGSVLGRQGSSNNGAVPKGHWVDMLTAQAPRRSY